MPKEIIINKLYYLIKNKLNLFKLKFHILMIKFKNSKANNLFVLIVLRKK
jgi:hypothetical protein